MLSIGESIQNVQSLYSKGVESKDSRLAPRHIYSSLIKARSTIISQMDSKGQRANDWIYQVLPCVELIDAPISECPCIPQIECSILRTKYKLPVPIAGLDESLIRSMSTLDGNIGLDLTTFETVKYDAGKKYTSTKPGYYIRNQFAYISHRTRLKAVTLNGLFDDPIEVFKFPSICEPCDECLCKDYMEIEFPIDRKMLDAICKLASNELIGLFGQRKEDKVNNATDDTENRGQMIHQPTN